MKTGESFPKHVKAGEPAIRRDIMPKDEFYLSSMAEEGPLVRRVRVIAVDGPVAIVDTWDFGGCQWAGMPLAVDLTRVRYVAPAHPMIVKVKDEAPPAKEPEPVPAAPDPDPAPMESAPEPTAEATIPFPAVSEGGAN